MYHFFVTTATLISYLPCVYASGNAPSALTSSGQIIGHTAFNRSSVGEFLGIKYAVAPVGDLRFAPPRRYKAPAGEVYNADNWNAHIDRDCPSNKPPISTFPNFTEPSGLRTWKAFAAQNNNPSSEDCLKLNVWAKPINLTDLKPVLVFFHGGRYQIPGPHSPFYNGQYLADSEDVVVVTVNYRLGIFGFSGALGIQQNAALLDQRSAVEWVKDNISAFGGDPKRIVIFGQSAGGASVDYFSFAWKDDPIISGLIPHSGTSLSFIPNTPDYAESIWYNVTETIGCGTKENDPAEVLACVRKANVSTVLAAAAKVPPLPTQALFQATFHPTVDNITVFGNYEELTSSGQFAKIPMLVGNNDDEAGWYRISAWGAEIHLSEERWTLFNERAFTCPSKYTARARVAAGVPTWRYRYHGDWDSLRLYNGSAGLDPQGSGAYHGSELGILFGTALDITGLPNTAAQDATTKYMMGAWAAFARDSTHGLTNYGWPGYNESENSLVRLAYKNQAQPSFVAPSTYDSNCPLRNDPLPGQGAF